MQLADLVPPIAVAAAKRALRRSARYTGRYATWSAAAAESSGYDGEQILAKVLDATQRVLNGEGAYERDSVVFAEPAYPFHLIAALLRAAVDADGRLSVLDFGGSLGSTYRQCRKLLPARLTWNIVEQAGFVVAGRQFENDELRFYERIADIPAERRPNVVLFSSVLQYLSDPFDVLAEIEAGPARYLVIDRTPFTQADTEDAIVIQHVPARIYPASYPMRIFASDAFAKRIEARWTLLADFQGPEGSARTDEGLPFDFRGLILRRNA